MKFLFSYSCSLLVTMMSGLTTNLSAQNLPAQTNSKDCHKFVKDISIKSVIASASTWKNLLKSEGSVSYESNLIFHIAKDEVVTLAPPTDFCPKDCLSVKRPVIFFRSVPQKVLTEYEDAEHCDTLQKKTFQQPLHYQTTEIHSIDELNEWIGDLSQGEGDNGEDLYEKCDKSCSPRYEYTIAKVGEAPNEYLVQASIICGAARDKDDNQYKLDSFFRWTCG